MTFTYKHEVIKKPYKELEWGDFFDFDGTIGMKLSNDKAVCINDTEDALFRGEIIDFMKNDIVELLIPIEFIFNH